MKLEAGQHALVTGASSGIGRALALALGRRGLHVVVVARNAERLARVASEIRAAGGTAEVLVADLEEGAALHRVEQRLRSEPAIDLFVNNAALGASGRFAEVSVEAAETQIRVNVLAATRLAHAAAGAMLERGSGALIQISSLTAFVPSVLNAVYSGTKAYLAILSQTLREELRSSRIEVVTVFPGFTRTEFQQRAKFEVADVPGFFWQTAPEVADEALAALEAGRSFCVPGLHNRVAIALQHLVPYSQLGRVAGLLARFVPGMPPLDPR